MLSPAIRISISLLLVAVAVFNLGIENLLMASISFVMAAYFGLGYFLYGTVPQAFHQVKRHRFEQAALLLKQTRKPQWLIKPQRAQYYFVQALIEANTNQADKARQNFLKALDIGLNSENNYAIAFLNLAYLELEANNQELARNYFEKAKLLKFSPELQGDFDIIEDKLNTAT